VKDYPSIPKIIQNLPIYSFDKIDGSSVRSEWNPKKGFYKFGSRTQLIDQNNPILGGVPDLIKSKYEKELSDIFKREKYLSAICFFEFWGKSSFAGQHDPTEEKTVTLFDVNPYKKGILNPKEYLDLFGNLDIAKLLYHGNPTSEFIQQVQDRQLEGMTYEGVVCKAKNPKNTPMPIMFKIKSKAWLEQLRVYCKGNQALFQKLA
jgi:hypothetical protein